MEENILTRIQNLPPLDDTVIKIQAICMDKTSTLGDLSDVIQSDPMLTANILKAANSPLYGFSREVKNIEHAVSLFGMATIRGFALSSAIRQNIKIDLTPYDITNQKFLDISTMQSALMLKWYSKVDRDMLDILTPAAFLMEVGKTILAHEIIEKDVKDQFLQELKKLDDPAQLSKIESEMLGYSNEEITAKVFEQWNLEIELVETIRYSNTPQNAPSHIAPFAVALHSVKTAVNIFEQLSENSIQKAQKLLENTNLDEQIFIDAAKQVKQ